MNTVVHLANSVLAVDPPGTGGTTSIGTTGLTKWLQDNVVTVLMLLIGISLLLAVQKAAISKVVLMFGLGMVGMTWLGMATTGTYTQVGTFLLSLFGVKTGS